MTAAAYVRMTHEVDDLIKGFGNIIEPDIAAYMVMRAAMLNLGQRKSPQECAETAYRLGDEFATAGRGR